MEFKEFNKKVKEQFQRMCSFGMLFRANITGDEIWNVYLHSFGEDDKIFRDPESSEHNCNHCKNFIRRYGNIVAINDEGELESIFSNLGEVGEYKNSAQNANSLIIGSPIKDIFLETWDNLHNKLNYESCKQNQDTFKLGIEKNFKRYTKEEVEKFGVVEEGVVYEFNHFCVDLPKQFVSFGMRSIESITAEYRDKYNVFKRAMEEISLDTLELVMDLINQDSLLDGKAHAQALFDITIKKRVYDHLKDTPVDNWLWETSYALDERTAKFKNTLIGVLCSELSEGKDLNKACADWNKRVDPINYHKAKAPITQKQINEAQKFVEDNGYAKSFDRRLVTLDDIKVNEILHSNVGDNTIKKVSVFDKVSPAKSTQHKRAEFDKVEEISIKDFMKDILPKCDSIEAYLENRMVGNLVTLTKAIDDDSKPIFKWGNNYSWTFNGNLAGKSQIRDAVKSRGGNIDGVLNIRLHFPNTTSDYDLHVTEPSGFDINYRSVRKVHSSSGKLDLDAQGVDGHQEPELRVENVTYTDFSKMPKGVYKVWVHDFSNSLFPADFTIEIETQNDTTILRFDKYKHQLSNDVIVAKIEVSDNFHLIVNDNMTIIESKFISKKVWNLDTNNFHKVNLISLSPNHWGNNNFGNMHYLFMLDNCKCDTKIRSFHNENLNSDLLKHRKVMEVLGQSTMIEPNGKHLAGLGFNSTVRDELIVRCKGSFKRMLKIKF